MSLINKPDYEVFASNARDGEVLPIPNVLRGWGETILLTEKIPPMEWFNWLAKRQDEWLLYLTQQGIAEWSEKVTYPTAAIAKFNGLFYVSIKETKGDNPASTQSAWKLLTEYFNIDGKLDKTEVKKTLGQSATSVMSQKAVTDALGKKLNAADLPVNTATLDVIGEWECSDTGLNIKWGEVNYSSPPSESDVRVTFKNPFKVKCLNVILTRKVSEHSGTNSNDGGALLATYDNNGFSANMAVFASSQSSLRGFTWEAKGY